jgi:lipopolysaccharide transport system ATP-binding protein
MSNVIRIQGVSKRYKLGLINRKMLYQELQSRWARWRGTEDPNSRVTERGVQTSGDLWALKDVTFDVKDGDVLGVIGRNGSGKSTLLKILSQITAPTEGRVLIKGKVASLLEVGTGFHPELTGRDNVFLNGAILGLSHKQIQDIFDSVVEFSGIEKFIDTPVKRYSSGMRVRLAFAVAAHLDPEILVIDEVLAVGDQAFQQKCLGKISEVARAGRTVLFVSHHAAAVENLCTKGIVLESGCIAFQGTQTEALHYYANSTDRPVSGCVRDRRDRSGNGDLRIVAIELRDSAGNPVQSVATGEDVDVCLHFENPSRRPLPRLNAVIRVRTEFDAPVFSQFNVLTGQTFGPLPESGVFVCRLQRVPLPPANYRLSFIITAEFRGGEVIDALTNAADFNVAGGDFFGTGMLPSEHAGVCLVDAAWRLDDFAPASTQPAPVATSSVS